MTAPTPASGAQRWLALALISIGMLTSYFFMDMLAPLQGTLERDYHWPPSVYGGFSGAMYFLNVFLFLIILSGILLDKAGVRFTGLTATGLMLLGGLVKLYGLSSAFNQGGWGHSFFQSFWPDLPPSAKLASLGFALYGIGLLMYAITASKAVVRWFHGKELALAMGIQLATARIGVALAFFGSAAIAGDPPVVTRTVRFGVLLLLVGFFSFLAFTLLDRRLDRSTEGSVQGRGGAFHISDIRKILTNRAFLFLSAFIALFYSSVYPFLKFAINMMQSRLNLSPAAGGRILSLLPIGAIVLTPIFGFLVDRRGKALGILMTGILLLTACHLTIALSPPSLPLYLVAILLLGLAFSMVPAALWQSIPKIVEQHYLGTSYATTYWIQNFGLWLVPLLVGLALEKANPGIPDRIRAGDPTAVYDYTWPLLIFVALGLLALVFGVLLKAEDRKGSLGLDLPNKRSHP